MFSQPEVILEQYPIAVHAITKGRGVYICDTSIGRKILAPYRGSKERAMVLEAFLMYLREQQLAAEMLYRTKEDEILAKDESGDSYLLKDMIEGTECSAKNVQDMVNATKALARLHICAQSCPLEIPDFMNSEKSNLQNIYEKHCRELVNAKNYVKSRKKRNEFEAKFQKEYPHFFEKANESLKLFQAHNPQHGFLCHGDVNHHNVLKTTEGWQLINYENIHVNLPMADFSNFFRKMMEKNDWDMELGTKMLEAYDSVRSIDAKEQKELYMILLFPEKFWKISNHYFNSHKAWLCERDIEKLDRVVQQEKERQLFLENLFSIPV